MTDIKRLSRPYSRSIIAIIVGLVMIFWPAIVQDFVMKFLGIALMGSSLFTIIVYFTRKREEGENVAATVPFGEILLFLFGLVLVIKSDFFLSLAMFLFGFLLIVGAIGQFMVMSRARKEAALPALVFIIPSLILVCGVIMLFNPFESGLGLFVFFGAVALFYGVSDLLTTIRVNK